MDKIDDASSIISQEAGVMGQIEQDDEEEICHFKKFQRYDLQTDPNQNDKATEIKLLSTSRPHMRAFHCSWWSFFNAFFIWFAISPLLVEVRKSLDIEPKDIWTSNICSVVGTILMRFLLGPLCDKYGARVLMGSVLMMTSIPCALIGLVSNTTSLAITRFFIGLAGSAFVMCQYWTTSMFTKEVAGRANAIVGGWGNLGGGAAQIIVGSVLFPLFKIFMSPEMAWRTVSIVPATFACITGFTILFISDDSPKGNYNELKRHGIMKDVSATTSFHEGAQNLNTWLLFLQYGCCFGVELTMNNAAAMYFQEKFNLGTEKAAMISSAFGAMNIFARALGGYVSDKCNSRMGLRGRLIWQTTCLLLEGTMVLCFAHASSLPLAITILVFFSISVQSAEGSTYGIVPYVNPTATGSISGIVGAGGSTGALCFGILFRQYETKYAFVIMGCTVFLSAALSFLIRIRHDGGILFRKQVLGHSNGALPIH